MCATGSPSCWDGELKLTHKTPSLSAEGQAVTMCQKTTLSRLAALALPKARISLALISHSSTACVFPRLCLDQQADTSVCVLMAAACHNPQGGGCAWKEQVHVQEC